ncbi:hypothetical protein HY384_02130 [Candidatus Daviesbacteria bacterium]|nr:hypothetical protein [Candidatus Daviesbacteria bacterium]
MAKPNNNNSIIMWVVGALIVGGVLGYLISQSRTPSAAYMSGTASMMKDSGSTMMQMGKMMMQSGSMMQQKGQKYGDQEMMQQGKTLEENGTMMEQKGTTLTERGNGMMQMMGQ